MFRQAGFTALWFHNCGMLGIPNGQISTIVLMNMTSSFVDERGCCWPHCVKALRGLKRLCGAYAELETASNAQDEELRALQRETGISSQRAADLRERLNFQCFKYELLVDMVCMLRSHNCQHYARYKCSSLMRAVLMLCKVQKPCMRAHRTFLQYACATLAGTSTESFVGEVKVTM